MQYQDLCNKIIEGVGGKDNVVDVSHCITRLRFRLKDESKADTAALKATKGVLDVIQAAGQYQVVIGATVEAVYADLVQVGGFATQAALDVNEDPELGTDGKKTDPFSRLLGLISEIFQPVLGMLMAGGFIQSLLAIATARMGAEFELTGTLAVEGCVRPCLLAWRASATGAWVFGDVTEGADVDALVAGAHPAAVLMTRAGVLN